MTNIYFDTPHLYYLTQYLPVFRELERRQFESTFVFYHPAQKDADIERVIRNQGLPFVWVDSIEKAVSHYVATRPKWIVFGNKFTRIKALDPKTKTAQLYHGIGMKSDVYNTSLMNMDIRFTEGPHYTKTLKKLFPQSPLYEVGYAKLDPLFSPLDFRPKVKLSRIGLKEDRPTLLYAPTFYPSSIEMMPDHMPNDFSDYNLIVKPHMFTWTKARYKKQRKKLRKWQEKANCHIPATHEFNLLPFMNTADLMISDASSALFEFCALDKPVVWCDFLKLRWTYRGLFHYRFKRRMDDRIHQYHDISAHAGNYQTLLKTVDEQLKTPKQYQTKRQEYTSKLIGKTDGKVSRRIVEYLLDRIEE